MVETDLHVLLVEDDEVDREAARRVFEQHGLTDRLHLASDGEDALAKLRAGLGAGELPRPLMILLDLNMPRMGGLEFLGEIRKDPALKEIPVIVTTISSMDEDIRRAYELGVDGYIVKPVGYEKFVQALTDDVVH